MSKKNKVMKTKYREQSSLLQQQLASRTDRCKICGIKLTRFDKSHGELGLCPALQCLFDEAKSNEHHWQRRAEEARLKMVALSNKTMKAEDGNGVDLRCIVRGCDNVMNLDTLYQYESGMYPFSDEVFLPILGCTGTGRCDDCVLNDNHPYYCAKHAKRHVLHHIPRPPLVLPMREVNLAPSSSLPLPLVPLLCLPVVPSLRLPPPLPLPLPQPILENLNWTEEDLFRTTLIETESPPWDSSRPPSILDVFDADDYSVLAGMFVGIDEEDGFTNVDWGSLGAHGLDL